MILDRYSYKVRQGITVLLPGKTIASVVGSGGGGGMGRGTACGDGCVVVCTMDRHRGHPFLIAGPVIDVPRRGFKDLTLWSVRTVIQCIVALIRRLDGQT